MQSIYLKFRINFYTFVSVLTLAFTGCINLMGADSPPEPLSKSSITWQAFLHQQILTADFPVTGKIQHLAHIPDSAAVIGIYPDGQVWLINSSNLLGKKLCHLPDGINATALQPKDGLLALAGRSDVRVYDLQACKERFITKRINTRVSNLEFHPDGKSLILAGLDSRIYRWHFLKDNDQAGVQERALTLERYFGHPTQATALVQHYDGRIFFSGDGDGLVFAWRFYDADRYQGEFDKNQQFGLRGHSEKAIKSTFRIEGKDGVEGIKLTQDGKFIVLASKKGNVEIRKVRGFKSLINFPAHKGLIYDLVILSAEPLSFVTVGRDSHVKVWQGLPDASGADQYKAIKRFDHRVEHARKVLALSADSLLISTADGNLEKIIVPKYEN